MRVFQVPKFARFAEGERITPAKLRQTALAAVNKPDAALGAGLVKQRIARKGQGKSGGYRAILVLKTDRWVLFLHGFAKNDADNIAPKTLKLFKEIAGIYLACTDETLADLVEKGELQEIEDADEEAEEA